jgi:hypothetical protein
MLEIKGFVLTVICFLITFSSAATDVHVKGYYKKDGTYIAPHYRSAPNATVIDNWSTYGNINPHTGEIGSRRVYDQNQRLPNSVLKQTAYFSAELDSYQAPFEPPISKQEQKETLDYFWQTLLLFFLFTFFTAPLIDRWLSNIFSQREHYASLFSLKSFVLVYFMVPLLLNIILHFYLISS